MNFVNTGSKILEIWDPIIQAKHEFSIFVNTGSKAAPRGPPIWGVKFVEKLGFPNVFGSGKKTY